LGALTPDLQQRLESARLDAEDATARVQTALLLLQEVNAPKDVVSRFQAEMGVLQDVQLQLHGELATMVEDADADAWLASLQRVRAGLVDLEARIEVSRKGAHTSLEFSGLYWGFGAAAVALVTGYVVWRSRKKRTSRR
jgi:hypothetical protein